MTKVGGSAAVPDGGDKHTRHFNREIMDMISAITSRITDKPGSSRHEEADEHGVRIITLAGTNGGATMRTELDHDLNKSDGENYCVDGGDDQDPALSSYVNSNFQAVNNSIMMDSSYNTNDPGVHLDVSDGFSHSDHGAKAHHHMKHHKKGKGKKDKGGLDGEHRSGSDSD